jgi:phosphatidylserine decarboxylase
MKRVKNLMNPFAR